MLIYFISWRTLFIYIFYCCYKCKQIMLNKIQWGQMFCVSVNFKEWVLVGWIWICSTESCGSGQCPAHPRHCYITVVQDTASVLNELLKPVEQPAKIMIDISRMCMVFCPSPTNCCNSIWRKNTNIHLLFLCMLCQKLVPPPPPLLLPLDLLLPSSVKHFPRINYCQ